MEVLKQSFFNRNAPLVARDLLGKVIRVASPEGFLAAEIIETEAYDFQDQASHGSKKCTPSREALWMEPGTIYMYYCRGAASLNVSVQGEGCAVLVKSAYPYFLKDPKRELAQMQKHNPKPDQSRRSIAQLCKGQTLLCKSLNITVEKYNKQALHPDGLALFNVGNRVEEIIDTTRLGLGDYDDQYLWYRYINAKMAQHCTSNPLSKKSLTPGVDYALTRWFLED